MSTCPLCGKAVFPCTRDLSSGLCGACAQVKVKAEAEVRARADVSTEAQRQEIAQSIENLQKLRAQGALTDEEFKQLEAVRQSTAAPGPPTTRTAKKVLGGILARFLVVGGGLRLYKAHQEREQVWEERRQKAEREQRDPSTRRRARRNSSD